jgi:asparagine synthase (glutamine-hydrolysing)
MTKHRYIALIATDAAARSAWEQAHTGACTGPAAGGGYCAVQRIGERVALFTDRRTAITIGDEARVVGSLYAGRSNSAVRALDVERAHMVGGARCGWLLRSCWGSYVAFIDVRHAGSVEVLRAPFGELGCYTAQSPFGILVASDVDLLRRFGGYTPKIDWFAVVRHLAAGDLHGRQTCLEGVDELSGGERLTDKAGRRVIDAPWRVWDFVGRATRMGDPLEAVGSVRDAVQTAISAQAQAHRKILLRLSGGLDSSIVAACLARTATPFAALTMITRDRGGDERVHARCVARHLGVALAEVVRNVDLVDLAVSEASALPRPTARAFVQASMRVARERASEYGATAIFDGGGGDNMFAALQSPAPAADCLHRSGGWGRFWRTARSIGIAADAGTLEVAQRAVWRTATRGAAYRWRADLSLLSHQACVMARGATDHPWLVPPARILPGSAAHVALLAAATSVVQSRDPQAAIVTCSPLISQPVAEACLRVPSWLWTVEGRNRAIARSAFRDALPSPILNRRDKGLPDSFLMELLDAHYRLIRNMLFDGVLVAQGLIDTVGLAAALDPAGLAKGRHYIRVLELVDAEAWARSWLSRAPEPC